MRKSFWTALAIIALGLTLAEGHSASAQQSAQGGIKSISKMSEFQPSEDRRFWLVGYVKEGSLGRDGEQVSFALVDGDYKLAIIYNGVLPDLFKEGEPAVVAGILETNGFIADSICVEVCITDYLPERDVRELRLLGFIE